jgi:anaerobic magnesium-protoporphyrin IX monomethyl ester cyclase
MNVVLVGAELEENLGLRYMASALEQRGHRAEIVPFNSELDIPRVVEQAIAVTPQIVGLSMVFTTRAREFCRLAHALRGKGYRGHLIAGGHFASFNYDRLLHDFPAFDSVGLGEGEELICALADHLDDVSQIPGLCYRQQDGSVVVNPAIGNPDDLDALPSPRRTTFHEYFGRPVASILSSRGCWRNCAFCSINAWYKKGGGKKFRVRSVESIVAEMKDLYFHHGVRIFNFQDDNFFLPDPAQALQRFQALRAGLQREGVEGIAIAIKARPDSITYDSIQVLDSLGLFRVFLGVENASETALHHLNRKCTLDQILNALQILNDFDVHVAYNLLMFEPDTVLDDILINLRFIERHMDNPFNFCRAEAYAGTGLESKLRAESRLLGDYFGFDYRLKDARSEAFHQIANYAFFDRNFSDFGLHYFNMQVDFYFQLLRRFCPQVLTQTLRGAVRSFIKETNLDTYRWLCQIYDFVAKADPDSQATLRGFAREMRQCVDETGKELRVKGEHVQRRLGEAYERRDQDAGLTRPIPTEAGVPFLGRRPIPYRSLDQLGELELTVSGARWIDGVACIGMAPAAIPYHVFKSRLEQEREEGR